jgi:hypothetical protein
MELLVDVIVGFVLGYDVGPSFRGIAASGDERKAGPAVTAASHILGLY